MINKLDMKARYECVICGSVHELPRELDIKDVRCSCGAKKLVLLNSEYSLEELDKAKIELGETYEQIIEFFREWIDMPEDYMKLIAVWIIGTYMHKSFNTYPYLFFNASKGSGKTRILRIISYLQANGNGNLLNNASDSVLFRTAQERGLIFDEFESEKSKEKQTMREYLNSCYKKGGVVYRMEKIKKDNKEEYIAVPHELYTPVAMANINGIEEVLADRAVTIILEKSMRSDLVKKIEYFDSNTIIDKIKATLRANVCIVCSVSLLQGYIEEWNNYVKSTYIQHIHTIHTIHKDTEQDITPLTSTQLIREEMFRKIDQTGIFGRNLELFFPLLITASLIGEDCFNDLIKIVKEIDGKKMDDQFTESIDISLIDFVSKKDSLRFEYKQSNELLREFKEFIGYQGEEEMKHINPTWFGLALKRLGLVAKRRREARGVLLLLNVDKAKQKIKIFKSEDVKKEEGEE